jgi:hypothetical protein
MGRRSDCVVVGVGFGLLNAPGIDAGDGQAKFGERLSRGTVGEKDWIADERRRS